MNEMAAYLDATLAEEDRLAMRDHFRNCRMCALALAELRELLGLPPQDPGLYCTASIKSLPGIDKTIRRATRQQIERCVHTTAG